MRKIKNEEESDTYKVIYAVKYLRTMEKKKGEPNPTKKEIEEYVSKSERMKEFTDYINLTITAPVVYLGKLRFQFHCKKEWGDQYYWQKGAISPKSIADLFFTHSLADGEWESEPGNGNFVYPTRQVYTSTWKDKSGKEHVREYRGELGLFDFDYIVVDNTKFSRR